MDQFSAKQPCLRRTAITFGRSVAPRRILPVLLFAFGFGACSPEDDPRKLPYRLELERQLHEDSRPVDLDGDGLDELYYRYLPGDHSGRLELQALVLRTPAGAVIDQVNYTGHIGEAHFRDIEGDGVPEAFVPVVRNDSAFVSVVSSAGKKLYSLFLIEGAPRIEPEGVIPWDPSMVDLAVTDFDQDGGRELLTVFFTGYARHPRGVLIHSLTDGRPLGRALVGAAIRESIIDDFDGDGQPEILVAAAATRNGGHAGGFDDSRAHVILFDTWPAVRPVWHRTLAPTAGVPALAYEDFDGDGQREVLLATPATDHSTLELLEPGSWRAIRVRRIPGATLHPAVLDVDRDGRPEVVVPRPPHDVLLYDDDLELIRRRRAPSTLSGHARVLPDQDGDGIDEIVLVTESNSLIVGPRLQLKAMIPGLALEIHAMRRDRNLPPAVVVNRSDGVSELFVIRPNPFYLVWRHGPWAGGTAAAAALLLLGRAGVRFRRRKYALETVHAVAQESDPCGVLVIDRRGRILLANELLRSWCSAFHDGRGRARTIDHVAATMPDLATFCRECLATSPPRPIAGPRSLRLGPDAPLVHPRAHPAHTGSRSDPHWVIRLEDVASSEQSELQAAWAPLAQRIAHDLRNPLTSVLLTLKRMQIEYREVAPDAAARLDTYNDRVQERVDHLRRLTSNFLKLLGEERLHCEELDLNAVASQAASRIRSGLPPDIRLVTRLADALPAVDADREQIESVLENLVANAVNAMPNGGAITISTHVARDLRIHDGEPRDFVQLEVMDTGTGIDPSDIGQLFTPGFSRSEHGSGLGLAIVRKIVNDHGGEVSVASEPGAGTALTILLPVPRVNVSDGDGTAAAESARA